MLLAINPNDAETLNHKGNVLTALNKYKEAIVYYDMSLAINPNYAEANNKGIALAKLKKILLFTKDLGARSRDGIL
jgi:tetratricopeptide (TPR) repeat protein